MSSVTRHIGLSLGADLCWPMCFEQILKRADLELRIGDDCVRFDVERMTIEPFDLRQPCRYDIVLDRLTHWYHTSREWIKKAVLLDGLYVLNNPWSLQSMEKQTTYCAMMKLGLPVPQTWLAPPKAYDPAADLQVTLERYAKMFDLGAIGEQIGFPLYVKPYDGGGWVGVNRIESADALREAYEGSGTQVLHLQKAVEGFDLFVRCIGIGPQLRIVAYDPGAPLHDRYRIEPPDIDEAERRTLRRMTLTINAFFGWDFNSCEALRQGEVFHPIDFANACPDSQVTSLHYHFPWLVLAKLRWALYCAATRRPFRLNLNWDPYFQVAAQHDSFADRLAGYGALAEEHFDTERFEAFCDAHLRSLDEVAYEYFQSEEARDTVHLKVAALYPAEEVEQFTELFLSRIAQWLEQEGRR